MARVLRAWPLVLVTALVMAMVLACMCPAAMVMPPQAAPCGGSATPRACCLAAHRAPAVLAAVAVPAPAFGVLMTATVRFAAPVMTGAPPASSTPSPPLLAAADPLPLRV